MLSNGWDLLHQWTYLRNLEKKKKEKEKPWWWAYLIFDSSQKKTKMVYACVHALVSLQSICWMEKLWWFLTYFSINFFVICFQRWCYRAKFLLFYGFYGKCFVNHILSLNLQNLISYQIELLSNNSIIIRNVRVIIDVGE